VGRSICKALDAQGFNVVALDLNLDGAEETVAGFKNGLALQADITSEEAVQSAFFQTLETFGSVDLLVNCAGVCVQKRLGDTSLKDWNLVLSTNVTGAFLCSREAWKVMREQNSGHIIHIASQAAGWPGFNELAYGTAKTAQLKLGLHIADEFRFENLLRSKEDKTPGAWFTHIICPGAIDTPMNQQLGRKIPKEQLLQPEDISDLICEMLNHPDKGYSFFQTLEKPYHLGDTGWFADFEQAIRIWQEK
jgi:NAD(P)-dependent dehydrogenase (short-subunit alcohol dehydrogenase family)